MDGVLCEKNLKEGREREKELLWDLLLHFFLIPMGLAHIPVDQPLLVLLATTVTQRFQSTTGHSWEGPLSTSMRVCGSHKAVGEAAGTEVRSYQELLAQLCPAPLRAPFPLPNWGCLCWAPELLLVLFQPGCQPGKQSSQPKREQVGGKNGSDIPACHQQRFQSNRAGEAEPAELLDE